MNLHHTQEARIPTGIWHVYSRRNGIVVVDGEIRARTKELAIAVASDAWDVARFHLSAHYIRCCTGRC